MKISPLVLLLFLFGSAASLLAIPMLSENEGALALADTDTRVDPRTSDARTGARNAGEDDTTQQERSLTISVPAEVSDKLNQQGIQENPSCAENSSSSTLDRMMSERPSAATPWNPSLQDFRNMANDAQIQDDQAIGMISGEEGTSAIGALLNGHEVTAVNHEPVVKAFIAAIRKEKGTTLPFFSYELRNQAMAEGLTPNIIRQVFHKIEPDADSVWRDVPGIPSSELTSAALSEVLNNFALSLPAAITEPGVDPELVAAFNRNRECFLQAYRPGRNEENNLPLALSYKNILEDLQYVTAIAIKQKATSNPLEIAAWAYVVRAIKKCVSLQEEAIQADFAHDAPRSRELSSLIKIHEDIVTLRLQAAEALEAGKMELAHRLMANDLDPLFENIETHQTAKQAAVTQGHGPLAEAEQKIIEAYGKIISLRKEAAQDLAQGAVDPAVSQAYLVAEEIRRKEIQFGCQLLHDIQTDSSYGRIKLVRNIIFCYENAANARAEAIRMLKQGNPIEAGDCIKITKEYEKAAEVGISAARAETRGVTERWESAYNAFRNLATQRARVYKLLSVNTDGTKHWRNESYSDFNNRFEAAVLRSDLGAYESPFRETMNLFRSSASVNIRSRLGDAALQDHLIDDLRLMEQHAHAAEASALAFANTEGDVALNRRVSNLWYMAAVSYDNYANSKRAFYYAVKNEGDLEMDYFLTTARNHEQRGDALCQAITAVQAHQEEVASRWLAITELRKNMITRCGSYFSSDTRERSLRVYPQCERIIDLKTQAIEALQRGEDAAAINTLDQQVMALEPAARAELQAIISLETARYEEMNRRLDIEF